MRFASGFHRADIDPTIVRRHSLIENFLVHHFCDAEWIDLPSVSSHPLIRIVLVTTVISVGNYHSYVDHAFRSVKCWLPFRPSNVFSTKRHPAISFERRWAIQSKRSTVLTHVGSREILNGS